MKSGKCLEKTMCIYNFVEWDGTNLDTINRLLWKDPDYRGVVEGGDLYIKNWYRDPLPIGTIVVVYKQRLYAIFFGLCDFKDRFEIIEEGEGK